MGNIVVADSGPLHYLALIDCADILEPLFDEILIPIAVRDELSRDRTPEKVKKWLAASRPWLSVRPIANPQEVAGLHRGETEVLQLALEMRAGAVLLDDLDARNAARRIGLVVAGTVGILELAVERNLVRFPEVVQKLRQTNFFISAQFLDAALERHRRRQTGC